VALFAAHQVCVVYSYWAKKLYLYSNE